MRVPISARLLLAATLAAQAAAAEVIEGDSGILFEAIERANTGLDETLELTAQAIYLLDRGKLHGQALPLLRGSLTIHGRGATIHGYPGIREALFHVAPGAALTLVDLSISEAAAGALLNHGSSRLERVVMQDNAVVRARAVVVNHGKLTLRDSELRHNLVHAGWREAGTMLNFGSMEIVGSTFFDNAMDRSDATVVVAGCVLNRGVLHVASMVALGNRSSDFPERRGFGEIVDLGFGMSHGNIAAGMARRGGNLADPAAEGTSMQARSRP